MTELARDAGNVVGLHPEGTRNRGADPYTLLPAQPGVGEVVYWAKPIVLPAFILGLGNDLAAQVRSNFDGTGLPITLVFGAPVDMSAFACQPPRRRTYKRVADRLRAAIAELAEQERQIRRREMFPSLEPARVGAPAECGRSRADGQH